MLDEPADDVARLTIVNPARRNALDHAILDALAAGRRRAGRALPDPHRCRGHVLRRLRHRRHAPRTRSRRRPRSWSPTRSPRPSRRLEAYEYPVVAALSGHTIGGGLELALSADLRVAAAGIKLGMPPAKLGLVYSHTGLQKFVHVVGAARTRELFLVGRNVDAQTALGWGLVNEVVDARRAAGPRAGAGGRDRRQRAAVAERQQAHPARAGRGRRTGSTPSWSASWWSCAAPASCRRTSARECGRSARSARRAGRAAECRQRRGRRSSRAR